MAETMYIYGLKDRKTGHVGYVGGSKDPRKRYGQHLSLVGSNKLLNAWLGDMDDLPELMILEELMATDNWHGREQWWICHLLELGEPLLNLQVLTSAPWRCRECDASDIPHQGNGLCRNCYMRWYRAKQAELTRYTPEDMERTRQEGYDEGYDDGFGQGFGLPRDRKAAYEEVAKALPKMLRDLGVFGCAVSFRDGALTLQRIGTKVAATLKLP